MESLYIGLTDWTVGELSEVVGPYLMGYLRRRRRSRGLGIYLSSSILIELHVGDVGGIDFSTPAPAQMEKFVVIAVQLDPYPSKSLREKVALELIAHVPREEVVHFRTNGDPIPLEGVPAKFPDIRALHFERTHLDVTFWAPAPDRVGEFFPSLKHVVLDHVAVRGGDWSSLTNFLVHRASSGNQLDTLEVKGRYVIPSEVVECIKRVVRDFMTSHQ